MQTLERTLWILAIAAVVLCAIFAIKAAAALAETGFLRDAESSVAPRLEGRLACAQLPPPDSSRWPR